MRYNAGLGIFGNIERAFSELNKTNNKVFNTQSEVQRVDAEAASALGGITELENALCEMDAANAEWSAEIENALCELDSAE